MTDKFTIRPHGKKPYHAGLAVPIFSLRSKNSLGIGQFSDLKLLSDFAKKSGMDIIQLLPVNDTTIFMDWRDSSPYRAISVFALHPVYLDLTPYLPELAKTEQTAYLAKQKALNALAQVDYEETLEQKWHFTSLIFKKMGTKTLASKDF